MILYRVLAAHKLWELLRSDKDGLVDDEPLNPNNSDLSRPDDAPQGTLTTPTEAGSTDEVTIDIKDDMDHKEAGSTIDITGTNTLGISSKHHSVVSASGEVTLTVDIHDVPGDLTPQTSAAKTAAPESAQDVSKKAASWWKKAWHYVNRPGYTGAGRRVLWQLLDLELFHILYVNIIVGMTGSSAPQRMLKVYEAVFEAAPQVQH